MAEKYAPKLSAKDERVQVMAWEDSDITLNLATENVAAQPHYKIKIGSFPAEIVAEAGKLLRPSIDELIEIINDTALIKVSAAPAAEKGAADIIQKIAESQKVILEKEIEKESIYYADSTDMFNSIVLYIKPNPDLEPAAWEKLILYSDLRNTYSNYLVGPRGFAGGGLELDERALEGEEASEFPMPGPTEPAEKYSEE